MKMLMGMLAGMGVGLVMVWLVVSGWSQSNDFISFLYNLLNLPALSFLKVWDSILVTQKRGEILLLVPFLVFAQWSILGALLGTVWAKGSGQKGA